MDTTRISTKPIPMTNILTYPTLLRLINAILPPVAWAGFIFFLSSQPVLPGIDISSFDFLLKKTGHMVVYAVLYVLLYRATAIIMNSHRHRDNWLLFAPLLICFIYAISDELHQSFTPNRYATVRDVGYDMLGTSIAFLKIYRYI
jgi:VanZ family protein